MCYWLAPVTSLCPEPASWHMCECGWVALFPHTKKAPSGLVLDIYILHILHFLLKNAPPYPSTVQIHKSVFKRSADLKKKRKNAFQLRHLIVSNHQASLGMQLFFSSMTSSLGCTEPPQAVQLTICSWSPACHVASLQWSALCLT